MEDNTILKRCAVTVLGGFLASFGWAILCTTTGELPKQLDLCVTWWGVSILIGLSQVLESFCD